MNGVERIGVNSGNGDAARALCYEIKIKGRLEAHWSDWLGGLDITQDAQGDTLLTGAAPDQAALYGILLQIRDLGLTLLSLAPAGIMEKEIKE